MRGEVVRKLRLLKGMTQQEVAAMLNVSHGAIHQIESNRLKMSDRLRWKFKEALNITQEMIDFVERF